MDGSKVAEPFRILALDGGGIRGSIDSHSNDERPGTGPRRRDLEPLFEDLPRAGSPDPAANVRHNMQLHKIVLQYIGVPVLVRYGRHRLRLYDGGRTYGEAYRRS